MVQADALLSAFVPPRIAHNAVCVNFTLLSLPNRADALRNTCVWLRISLRAGRVISCLNVTAKFGIAHLQSVVVFWEYYPRCIAARSTEPASGAYK